MCDWNDSSRFRLPFVFFISKNYLKFVNTLIAEVSVNCWIFFRLNKNIITFIKEFKTENVLICFICRYSVLNGLVVHISINAGRLNE